MGVRFVELAWTVPRYNLNMHGFGETLPLQRDGIRFYVCSSLLSRARIR